MHNLSGRFFFGQGSIRRNKIENSHLEEGNQVVCAINQQTIWTIQLSIWLSLCNGYLVSIIDDPVWISKDKSWNNLQVSRVLNSRKFLSAKYFVKSDWIYQILVVARLLFGCSAATCLLFVYLRTRKYLWPNTCGFVKKMVRNLI